VSDGAAIFAAPFAPERTKMSKERVCVGAIIGAFGLGGEVRLKSFCATPAAIADYAPLFTDDNPAGFSVTITRPVKNGFAARLSGIQTREQADDLRGTQLFADRDRLPELTGDEFYHADLIGLSAFDTGGQLLGTITAVLNHGAGDLLEVRPPNQSATVLVPFTRDVVPTVDLTARRVIIDAPAGLFADD
jgi:16S rRNA processing protein RimM